MRSWRCWLIRSIAVLVVVLLLFGPSPDNPDLVLTDAGSDRILLTLPLLLGPRFTLEWVHSVTGTPIQEAYRVAWNGTIWLEEVRFEAMGAGLDHWPGHGCLASRGSVQVIEGIHQRIGTFTLRVGGPEVDHCILGEPFWRLRLRRLAQPGTAVRVSARPGSWRRFLWYLVVDPTGPILSHPALEKLP